MIIAPATPYDIIIGGSNLRHSDRIEVLELAVESGRWAEGWDIVGDLLQAFQGEGEIWTIWKEDEIVGFGGVYEDTSRVKHGSIWFLGTPLADENIISVTKICRRFRQMWNARGWYVWNVAPLNQPNRLKWLETVGFDILPDLANHPYQGFVAFVSRPDPAPQG